MAKTLFTDGNILTKTGGVRVLAAWLNKVFSHRHDGLDQDGSAPLDFAVDTGEANAIVVAMTPTWTALVVGMPFTVKAAATNTDAVTVAVDGLDSHPLLKLGGVPLVAGDIQADQIIQIAWDGASFQLLSYNSPPVTDASTLQGQSAAMLAPPGTKGEFFMSTMPAGWLPCDGRAVLRSQYPALFAAIGTFWGGGDNVTTFNLPEVRGEFFRAWDQGRGVDPDRGFGTWQDGEIESHTHGSQYDNRTPAGIDGNGAGDEIGGKGTTWTYPTTATGGDETRPRNIAVFVGIKY